MASSVAPLTECAFIGYDMPMKIGPSLDVFHLIVDTGSVVMAVASNQCTNCGNQLSPLYRLPDAATGGEYTLRYGDGAGLVGLLMKDDVSVANNTLETLSSTQFLAVTSQINSFFNNFNCGDGTVSPDQGIVGMAFNNDDGIPGFMDALMTDHYGELLNQFTLQLCTQGGNLWISEYDGYFLQAPFQFVPLQEPYDFYRVQVQSVALNESILIGQMMVIVDSGTTQMILPTDLYTSIVDMLNRLDYFTSRFGQSYFDSGYCMSSESYDWELNANLPSLTFTFTSTTNVVVLQAPPVGSYLLPYHESASGQTLYCPGIASTLTSTSSDGLVILGDAFMNHFTINFDRDNFQLGFSQTAHCGEPARTNFAYYATDDWTPACPHSYYCDDAIPSQHSASSFCTFSNGTRSTNATVDCRNGNPYLQRQCNPTLCTIRGVFPTWLIILIAVLGTLILIVMLVGVGYCFAKRNVSDRRRVVASQRV